MLNGSNCATSYRWLGLAALTVAQVPWAVRRFARLKNASQPHGASAAAAAANAIASVRLPGRLGLQAGRVARHEVN